MHFKIDAGTTVYQLVVDGTDGDISDYGAPSFCTVGGETFMAMAEEPENDGEEPNEIELYKVTSLTAIPEVELVSFNEDSEGNEDSTDDGTGGGTDDGTDDGAE